MNVNSAYSIGRTPTGANYFDVGAGTKNRHSEIGGAMASSPALYFDRFRRMRQAHQPNTTSATATSPSPEQQVRKPS